MNNFGDTVPYDHDLRDGDPVPGGLANVQNLIDRHPPKPRFPTWHQMNAEERELNLHYSCILA